MRCNRCKESDACFIVTNYDLLFNGVLNDNNTVVIVGVLSCEKCLDVADTRNRVLQLLYNRIEDTK